MLVVAAVLAIDHEAELKRVKRQAFDDISGFDAAGGFDYNFLGVAGDYFASNDYLFSGGVSVVTPPSTGPVLIDNGFPGLDYGLASYDYYGLGAPAAFG